MPQPKINDAFLAHYGVKGMKWGKTGAGKSTSRKSSKASEPDSEDHVKSRQLKQKSLRTMSNKDIKELNERLQLEKTYKDLTKNQSAITKGRKASKDVLDTANVAQQFYNVATSPMAKALRKAVVGI